MPQTYSTGDLAKLAGVSVRTVQYYNKRGHPITVTIDRRWSSYLY